MRITGAPPSRTCRLANVVAGTLVWLLIAVAGCRKPHAPQSLAPERHGPVTDLAAIRGGDQLWLTWTVPKKGTARLTIDGELTVRVCRRENLASPCAPAGEAQRLAPGATGTFSESLPKELASGTPRPLYYFVEVMDRKGNSTGLSNGVPTLAGGSPPAVHDLRAEFTQNGVLLRWTPASPQGEPAGISIRLHRVRLIMATQAMRDGSVPMPQPEERDLMVDRDLESGRAFGSDLRSGETYEYSAQRLFHLTVDGQLLELAGPFSNAVQIGIPMGAQ